MSERERERDEFDDAVEYLTAHPDEIRPTWYRPHHYPNGGALFRPIDGFRTGCLSQIRHAPEQYVIDPPAFAAALIPEIVADERIPKGPKDIAPADLPVFAEWQRRIKAARVAT